MLALQATSDPANYRRRDPTSSLLYRTIQAHWQTFVRDRESEGRYLPAFVRREFEAFLGCGVLANVPVRQWVLSFPIQLRYWMARDPKLMSAVLAIVIRTISGFQRQRARREGFKKGESGSVTFVQRFGGSVNLNIHFHTLMIEGVFRGERTQAIFHEIDAPSDRDVRGVLTQVQKRVVRSLKRKGYPVGANPEETDTAFSEETELPLTELCQGASVQSQIATGERAGRRVRKLGSFGLGGEWALGDGPRCATLGGFSLHANTAVCAGEKDRLEKLCRYVARPPIAEMRLSESREGGIVYRFKKEWSDGTQAVYFSPLEFIEKLVALIPPPRIHLTRYHGVLGPNHRLRKFVVPEPPKPKDAADTKSADGSEITNRDARRLSWSELLKRVVQMDLTTCPDCGGALKYIAVITEPKVIAQILEHLGLGSEPKAFHPARPPPQGNLWGEFSA